VTEKQRNHRNDLANAKFILSVLLDYIPSLASTDSHDNISRDFDYTLITTYLPKGIRAVGLQLGQIMTLNISEFNLGDRKNYGMLAPHKYLKKTTWKKSKIIPEMWTMDISRSTILNVMKIPHFDRHQEINACVKLLMLCYHGSYLWLDRCITVDLVLIHRITGLSMQGIDPLEFYPGKVAYSALA
jgi:hypothetical protein